MITVEYELELSYRRKVHLFDMELLRIIYDKNYIEDTVKEDLNVSYDEHLFDVESKKVSYDEDKLKKEIKRLKKKYSYRDYFDREMSSTILSKMDFADAVLVEVEDLDILENISYFCAVNEPNTAIKNIFLHNGYAIATNTRVVIKQKYSYDELLEGVLISPMQVKMLKDGGRAWIKSGTLYVEKSGEFHLPVLKAGDEITFYKTVLKTLELFCICKDKEPLLKISPVAEPFGCDYYKLEGKYFFYNIDKHFFDMVSNFERLLHIYDIDKNTNGNRHVVGFCDNDLAVFASTRVYEFQYQ